MFDFITYLTVFVVGSVIGSFLNVCIYRIPKNISLIHPPSNCPHCEAPIKALDNIPIISFILLKGRCRHCQGKISWQYPIVEALTGIIFLYVWWKFYPIIPLNNLIIPAPAHIYVLPTLFKALPLFIFYALMIVISFIDYYHKIIPDILSFTGIAAGFIFSFFKGGLDPLSSFLGIVVGGGILFIVAWTYLKIAKKEGMGGGDVKYLAMIGAFLGWKMALLTLFLSAFLGGIIGAGLMLFAGKGRNYAIPFGPYLSIGAALCEIGGQKILATYFSLFGF